MSSDFHYFPGDDNDTEQTPGDQNSDTEQNVDISLPQTERPVGPFEHSGETARQTKAEEEEETDKE